MLVLVLLIPPRRLGRLSGTDHPSLWRGIQRHIHQHQLQTTSPHPATNVRKCIDGITGRCGIDSIMQQLRLEKRRSAGCRTSETIRQPFPSPTICPPPQDLPTTIPLIYPDNLSSVSQYLRRFTIIQLSRLLRSRPRQNLRLSSEKGAIPQ